MTDNGINEGKLARQEKLLETILENMAQAVVIVNSDLRIVEFNRQFKEMFHLLEDGIEKGIHYKEFLDKWARQVKADEEFISKAIERMLIKEPFIYEISFSYNGQAKWLQMFHNPLAEGGFVRTFTDITESKKAEKELEEKSNEIDRFFSLTVDFLCIVDMGGYIRRINQTWEKSLGYKTESLIGKRIFDYIHPDDIEDTIIAMSNLAAGKEIIDYINRYKGYNGEYRWLEWKAVPYDNRLIYAAARDITERISFEEILRQNEEKYRFLTENVGDIIWQIDKDYNYIYVSPSVENILGYTPEEIIGKSFYGFLTPGSADYLNEIEEKQKFEIQHNFLKSGVYELQHIKKDGSLVWCEVHSSPLYTPDGRLIFSQGVTRDINARKESERKLKDYAAELKELNATKDRFFSIISHDLKSPFNGLIGMTQEFKDNARDFSYEEIARFGKEMNDAVISTYRLLENLLEWSRVQLDQIQFLPENVRLKDEVEKLIDLFNTNASQKDITLANNVNEECIVYADLNMLSVILRNLLVNAIKFTHLGGSVEVSSECGRNVVLISASDNGIGMAEEARKKLFRQDTVYSTYGTEKEKGTGLGLLLCREFVEKHNGEIWAESELGKGTRIIFTLPAGK